MSERIVSEVRVKNEQGLHARPATTIVKILQNVKSEVSFTKGGHTVDAKSLLNILMLAATKNSKIKITVTGEDAKDVLERLLKAFDRKFKEF